MSEYIIDIPDECFPTGCCDVYYPDERDDQMTVEPIVRCRDCRYYDQNDEPSEVYPDRYLCDLMANFLHPDGFCAWAERREP